MKDLVFLLITFGLIVFGMMLTQNQYYDSEPGQTQQQQRPANITPSPTHSRI